MSSSKIYTIIEAYPDEAFVIADGFDDAIIGVDEEHGRIVYDIDQVITILMSDNMSMDEAYDFYYYNIVGSYVVEKTPVFVKQL